MAIINEEEQKERALENAKRELESMCAEIYKGEYVLVVGGDAVLKEELGGGNSERYIKDTFKKMCPDKELTHENLRNFFKSKWKSDVEEANEDLVRLLETKCFRLVFTTTFDDYVERIMREVWGEELQVYSIYDNKIKSLAYSEYNIIKPTLVYAFGGINTDRAFVLNDDDAINAIAKRWLDSANKPTTLISYVAGNSSQPNSGEKDNSKKVLAIGCKLDDWEFRFFWYCLRQDVKKRRGDVAISLNEERAEDDKLRNYLTDRGVNDKGKSREFLNTLQTLLNDREKFIYERLKNELKSGGVFISYASEDFPVACQIYNMLVESGANVWFDNRELVGGDEYDNRISNAIAECKVFIPLLSATTAKDIQDGTWRYYKDVEWMQDEVKGYIPILITTSGFNIKRMREHLPAKFQNRSAIDWSENGFKSLLIKAVEKGMSEADKLRSNKTE